VCAGRKRRANGGRGLVGVSMSLDVYMVRLLKTKGRFGQLLGKSQPTHFQHHQPQTQQQMQQQNVPSTTLHPHPTPLHLPLRLLILIIGFYPYCAIAATLLHELSHNWVGEHNALFWSNYGQMRVEYMVTHKKLAGGVCH